MSNAIRTDAVTSTHAAADTCLSLANVYLEGVERLASLNLTTAREAIGACGAATQTLFEAQKGGDYTQVLKGLGQPMWDKAVAHSRGSYQIMLETSEALSGLIKAQWAQGPFAVTSWNGFSELFTQGVQQLTATAKENMASATQASSKMVAASSGAARKAA